MGLEFNLCGRVLSEGEIYALMTNYVTKKLAQSLCEIFYGDGIVDPRHPKGLVQRYALQALNILDMSGDEEPDWESPLWHPPLDVAAALRRLAAAVRDQDSEVLRLLRHVVELYPTSHTFEQVCVHLKEDAEAVAEHCERLAAAGETAVTFHASY